MTNDADVIVVGAGVAGLTAATAAQQSGLRVVVLEAHAPGGRARTTDRETVLKATLRALARTYAAWRSDPSALAPSYRSVCSTLGRRVRVELPGGAAVEGTATTVDDDGRLEVRDDAGGVHLFAAGDVVHLR